MKKEERVLFYQFSDSSKLAAIREVLDRLQIRSQVLPEAAYQQKVGYLLGMKGFALVKGREDDFSFPHEVMIYQKSSAGCCAGGLSCCGHCAGAL